MNLADSPIVPDWKWGTAEGSRDLDHRLTFREKVEWLEETETLSLRFQAIREKTVLSANPPIS